MIFLLCSFVPQNPWETLPREKETDVSFPRMAAMWWLHVWLCWLVNGIILPLFSLIWTFYAPIIIILRKIPNHYVQMTSEMQKGFDHVHTNMVLVIYFFFVKQLRCYHMQALIGQKPMVYCGGKLMITPHWKNKPLGMLGGRSTSYFSCSTKHPLWVYYTGKTFKSAVCLLFVLWD